MSYRNDQIAIHNGDLEAYTLGAALLHPDAWLKVSSVIDTPEHFFIERHRWIYEAMQSVYRETRGLDYGLLIAELDQRGRLDEAGGAAYVLNLSNGVPSALNAENYAVKVKQLAWRRNKLNALSDIARTLHSEETPVKDVSQQIEALWRNSDIGAGRTFHTAETMFSELHDRLSARIHRAENGSPDRGLNTGVYNLNRLFGPNLNMGQYILLQGITGVGKSWLALQIALGLLSEGVPVIYFTYEGTHETVEERMLAIYSGVSYSRIQSGVMGDEDKDRIVQAMAELATFPLEVVDSLTTVDELRSHIQEAMLLRFDYRRPYVFVDNINNISDAMRGDGYENWGYVSGELLSIARTLGVGVMGLCQQRNDARNDMSNDAIIRALTPAQRTVEGSRKGVQHARGLYGIYNPQYIAQEVVKRQEFKDPDIPHGYVRISSCKQSDYNGPGECILKWNKNVPRYEMEK